MGTELCKSQVDKNQSPSMIVSDPHDMLESDRPVMWANTCSLPGSFVAASQHRVICLEPHTELCYNILEDRNGSNTFAVTQGTLAAEKLMSVQDLHQTHLYTGTSPQNFLTSMLSNDKLIDICCIANCQYRDSLSLDKNGGDISLCLRCLLICEL